METTQKQHDMMLQSLAGAAPTRVTQEYPITAVCHDCKQTVTTYSSVRTAEGVHHTCNGCLDVVHAQFNESMRALSGCGPECDCMSCRPWTY